MVHPWQAMLYLDVSFLHPRACIKLICEMSITKRFTKYLWNDCSLQMKEHIRLAFQWYLTANSSLEKTDPDHITKIVGKSRERDCQLKASLTCKSGERDFLLRKQQCKQIHNILKKYWKKSWGHWKMLRYAYWEFIHFLNQSEYFSVPCHKMGNHQSRERWPNCNATPKRKNEENAQLTLQFPCVPFIHPLIKKTIHSRMF